MRNVLHALSFIQSLMSVFHNALLVIFNKDNNAFNAPTIVFNALLNNNAFHVNLAISSIKIQINVNCGIHLVNSVMVHSVLIVLSVQLL